jgi:hypothetical protein
MAPLSTSAVSELLASHHQAVEGLGRGRGSAPTAGAGVVEMRTILNELNRVQAG